MKRVLVVCGSGQPSQRTKFLVMKLFGYGTPVEYHFSDPAVKVDMVMFECRAGAEALRKAHRNLKLGGYLGADATGDVERHGFELVETVRFRDTVQHVMSVYKSVQRTGAALRNEVTRRTATSFNDMLRQIRRPAASRPAASRPATRAPAMRLDDLDRFLVRR